MSRMFDRRHPKRREKKRFSGNAQALLEQSKAMV